MMLHSWREYGVVCLTFIAGAMILVLFNNGFCTFFVCKVG
jgi:hypothetical protein